MLKIAIVVDSSAGLSKQEATKNNWFFIPLMIFFDDKKLADGIDITSDNLFDHYNLESGSAKTSATPIGIAQDTFEKLSSEYDYVLVFPISKYLSSQAAMLESAAKDFANVRVIQSVYVAHLISLKVKEFESMIQKGFSFEEAANQIEKWDDQIDVTLVPKYNDYLVKGGRLSPAAATLAKLLQIVPMIKFTDGSLVKEGKGRIFSKTIQKVIDSKFENLTDIENYDCVILHSGNLEISQYVEYLTSKYNIVPYISSLANVIAMHTGPEAIVIIKLPKLSESQKALF
ncbi:DegV family protein [Mycoplasma buteonis]|uniref:DegV family protein n=1 Tax=Mycoplasma buteonis TaxID=171280 RepID=UPI000562D959|nr:DegV family protein [Mycoplasma buteonis]